MVIYWYGIINAAAVIIGLFLVIRESKRRKINTEFFLDYIIYTIPVAIICARLYYVVFRWNIYQMDLRKIIAIREGGLAIHGAVIGGILTLLFMSVKRKFPFTVALDILTPSLVLGQAIGRWGNFINQEAYGTVVSKDFISKFPKFIKNQMYIEGYYHHPAFLYESLLNLFIFIFIILIRKKEYIINGDILLIYGILYSTGRFFIEGIRIDSLMLGNYRVAQLISIIIIIICGTIFLWRHLYQPVEKEGE